jgi:hypothetical protein
MYLRILSDSFLQRFRLCLSNLLGDQGSLVLRPLEEYNPPASLVSSQRKLPKKEFHFAFLEKISHINPNKFYINLISHVNPQRSI